MTVLLDMYIMSDNITLIAPTFISFGVAYMLTSVYDSTIIKEARKDSPQVRKNTIDIKYTQEDVRILQRAIYQEEEEAVRKANARRVLRRRRNGGY